MLTNKQIQIQPRLNTSQTMPTKRNKYSATNLSIILEFRYTCRLYNKILRVTINKYIKAKATTTKGTRSRRKIHLLTSIAQNWTTMNMNFLKFSSSGNSHLNYNLGNLPINIWLKIFILMICILLWDFCIKSMKMVWEAGPPNILYRT